MAIRARSRPGREPTRLLLLISALLSACSLPSFRSDHGPAASLAYRDLALDSRAGRALLRERLETAARRFCRAHGKEVTPGELHLDDSYCLAMLRASLISALPHDIRKSHALADREAHASR